MTFGRFVVRNSFRNKPRTALTVLSVGFSIFLLILLRTVLSSLTAPVEGTGSDRRIVVRRSTSLTQQMPVAYEQRIERMPHVQHVMKMQWIGGYYREPKNFFPNFATDPFRFHDLFPEIQLTEGTWKDFQAERIAAIAGNELAKKYGWKIGDRMTLKGTIFPADLELKIVGLFNSQIPQQDRALYFRHDYLDEALGKPGLVGTFWIMADSPDAVPGLIDKVDAEFRNTTAETKSETEMAFRLGFISMMGNVQRLVGSIAVVILFTMLLVSASTMAMTIRERVREIGILKSIGYPRRTVLALILGEAVFIALLGGVVGSLAASGLRYLDVYELTRGFVPEIRVTAPNLAISVAIGAVIGLFSGLIPAIQASSLTIVQAMRRVA